MAYNGKNSCKFEQIWTEFRSKMRQDKLQAEEFTEEMQPLLSMFLCGPEAEKRREKFLSAPYEVLAGSAKQSVVIHCADDDYRFDFSQTHNVWKLSFIECITLPVAHIDSLPYADFKDLPEKEAQIRSEKEISRLVYFYNQFKKLEGKQKALEMFQDGAGESLCARSWVPFYNDRLSYIAYAAWMERRIYGEQVEIIQFEETCCCLRFGRHLWRRIYTMAGHIREMIDYDEYMGIFEAIWQDRASANGWLLEIGYHDEDTDLIFRSR